MHIFTRITHTTLGRRYEFAPQCRHRGATTVLGSREPRLEKQPKGLGRGNGVYVHVFTFYFLELQFPTPKSPMVTTYRLVRPTNGKTSGTGGLLNIEGK